MASKSLIRGNVFNERKMCFCLKHGVMLWAAVLAGGIANPHHVFLALVDPGFGDYGFRNMSGRVARTTSVVGKGSVTMLEVQC